MAEKDQELVRKTLAGDRQAFGDLLERYARLVRGVIWEAVRRPDEVEDLVQEVFCKAYEQLSALRRPSRFAGWLWQIAANVAIDYHRHRQQERVAAGAVEPAAALSLYLRSPDALAEENQVVELIWQALDRLEPDHRRIAVLHYFEGCRQREISRFLGLPLTTVKWRLFQARNELRDELLDKLGQTVQAQLHGRRRLRDKVMAILPASVFLHPRPTRWLSLWGRRGLWFLGSLAALGAGGVLYQALRSPQVAQSILRSREALRLLHQAVLLSEPSVTWSPPQPQAGQTVQIKATDLGVEKGTQPELHYIVDPRYPSDQVVPMHPEGGAWVAEFAVPADAAALFFYIAPRQEGPQSLAHHVAYLTTQKLLERYRHVLLVHDQAGRPLQGAAYAQALLAQQLGYPPKAILGYVDREIALYPEHFEAYPVRWMALLEADADSAEGLAQVRAEQEALRARYPDRPELLWCAAQVPGLGQEALYQELSQRFPGYEKAEDAAYLKIQECIDKGDTTYPLAALGEFRRRFPDSRYLDEIYRVWLTKLVRTAPDQAAQLADSLIHRTLSLPYDPAKEADQLTSFSPSGGSLPEAYAYSLRFDLFLQKDEPEPALALAHHLVASGLRDPGPYLYLGQALAGQRKGNWFLLPEDPPVTCPRDLSLAIQVLETGLPWTAPENLLELPGYNTYFSFPDHVRSDMRQLYLDQAYTLRQSFLLALAQCHRARGESPQAVYCLEQSAVARARVKRSFLLDDQTFYLLGEGYERLGKWEEAERAYLQAVAQDYSHPGAEAALRRMHQERYGHLGKLTPLLQTCYPQAPAFVLRDTLGREVQLSEFRGKLLLIYYDDLSNSPRDSGPMVSQVEKLKEWAERYQPQGLEILHISRSPGRTHSPFRLVLDDEGVGDRYQLRTLVSFVLIDRAGRLRLRQSRWSEEQAAAQDLQVVQKIEELIQEDRPPRLSFSTAKVVSTD